MFKLIKRLLDIISPYQEAYGPERIDFMTDKEMKDWIDNATYEQLLRKWRFSSLRDPFFQGAIGPYYKKKLEEKERAIGKEAAAMIDKLMDTTKGKT